MPLQKRQSELFAVGLKSDHLVIVASCLQKFNASICSSSFADPDKAWAALRHRKYLQQPGLVLLADTVINPFLWKAKAHPLIRQVPILVITNQESKQLIKLAYQQGANSVIEAPHSPQAFMEVMNTTLTYWFNYAALIQDIGYNAVNTNPSLRTVVNRWRSDNIKPIDS